MSQLFDSDFLNRIQRLVLYFRTEAESISAGNRKSRSKGSSVEFSDYREYVPGDDFRRIDWNAFGRFEKLFIKLFMEEREVPVSIFLDISKSMDWGVPNKNIASRKLAAALAYISLANFDKVSLACTDENARQVLMGIRGKNQFHRIIKTLEMVQYSGESDIQKAIESSHVLSGRGISILITDFFSRGNITELLKYLAYHKQTIYACHILSPQELSPDISESLRLVDSETGEVLDITVTPSLIKAYKNALDSFTYQVRQACIKFGAQYFQFSSEMAVEEMVKGVAAR